MTMLSPDDLPLLMTVLEEACAKDPTRRIADYLPEVHASGFEELAHVTVDDLVEAARELAKRGLVTLHVAAPGGTA